VRTSPLSTEPIPPRAIAWRLAYAAAFAAAACGLTAACGSQGTAPSAGIFWTQSPHGGEEEQGSIGRAHLDSSGAKGHFMIGAKAPAGVALDGGYVYWANYGSGTIARAKLDGSDVNRRFITGVDYPIGVAVDGRHIYWTNYSIDPNAARSVGRTSTAPGWIGTSSKPGTLRPGWRSTAGTSIGRTAIGIATRHAAAIGSGARTWTALV
jgi:hypothetical protein